MSSYYTSPIPISINHDHEWHSQFNSKKKLFTMLKSPKLYEVGLITLPNKEPGAETLEFFRDVVKVIADNRNPKKITIGFNEYEWDALKEFDPIFRSRYVDTLVLRGHDMISNTVAIKDYICHHFNLGFVPKSLNLNLALFLYDHLDEVLEAIAAHLPYLGKLVLPKSAPIGRGNGLERLLTKRRVDHLEFDNTEISSLILHNFVKASERHWNSLHTIKFSGRSINSTTLPIIGRFASSVTVLCLDDSSARFEDDDVRTFVKFIPDTTTLEELNIKNCHFKHAQTPMILNALAENKSIKRANLGHTLRYDDILQEMLNLISKNLTLTFLSVRNTGLTWISKEDYHTIREAIMQRSTCLVLDCSVFEPEKHAVTTGHVSKHEMLLPEKTSPKRMRTQ